MASTKAVFAGVIALTVGLLLAAVLAPVAINEVNNDDSYTLTQDNQTTYEVETGLLNSTVQEVNATTSPDNATIKLTDVRDSSSITKNVGNQSTVTYALTNGDVNVTVNDLTSGSPDTATVKYDVPSDFGWDSGSKAIWGVLPIIFVIGMFLVILRAGLQT